MTSIVAMLLVIQFSVGFDLTRTWIRLLRKFSEARLKGERGTTSKGIAEEATNRNSREGELDDDSDFSETTLPVELSKLR